MADKLLFVSESESFLLKSMMSKFEENGKETLFSELNIDKLKSIGNEVCKNVFLYIGKMAEADENALIFFNDFCMENHLEVNVFGYEKDIMTLKETIFKEGFAKEFYRPLNVQDIVEEILNYDGEAALLKQDHVLVVDDSGVMLTTIREWLRGKYKVSLANSALNAIALLNSNRQKPDLILLDYEMPDCTGAEFLEKLRADGFDIPVIFLTGHNDQETIKKIIGLKPAGYLLKALPKEKIVGMVDSFFKVKR